MTQTSGNETRDRGVALAIEAAGGVGPLARKLGISQPSVSGWSRVPAERVAAVEAATGINRADLRPDLFGDTLRPDPAGGQGPARASGPSADPVDGFAVARASEYRLLAALLSHPPKQALLDEIGAVKGDVSELGLAHIALASAARRTTAAVAGTEYFKLFIGVGRGELLPYASFYLTGFLNERPLARVREDMRRLGVERRDGVFEPEDHVSTLFEVMAALASGQIAGGHAEADHFFMRHIKPWAARLFADLAVAESADFYRAVANVGRAFIEIETAALDMPP